MTELQEARAKWLDAETRCLKLMQERDALMVEKYELQSKLITAQCQGTVMADLAMGYARAMLTV